MRKGEIIKRLDPYYHKFEFRQLRIRFSEKGFQYLRKFIFGWNRGDGPRDGFYTDDNVNGVYFLRVNNLKENSIDLTDVKFITRFVHEKTLKRSQVTAGDLVFAVSGTKDNLGTVSIVPDFVKEANLNSALIRLDLDWSKLEKQYFCLLFSLNLIRIQIDYIGKGAAQNNLNNEEVSQIQIPVPPIEVQTQIIEKFEAAYSVKRAKEAEAQSLLDGIDAYLLDKLGIEIPAKSDTKNTFFIRYSNLSGGRFDAPAYRTPFNYDSSKFQIEKLVKIAFINPKVTFEKLDIESEISFVPMEVINEHDGTIEELRSKKVKDAKGFTRFQEDDLIWAKITPCMQNGKSAVARNLKQGFACGSTEFYVIRPKIDDILIDYLHLLLRNKKVLENAQNFFGGSAGQQRVSIDFLRNFNVPIPPKDIQLELVEEFNNSREHAKNLEAEARAEIERAKAEVEKMILG